MPLAVIWNFLDAVDAVVMGWITYHQIITELSPDRWPYEGRPCYVATHRCEAGQEGLYFWNGPLAALADRLTAECGGNVWACGSASVAGQLLKENRVNKLRLLQTPPGQELFH